MKKILLQLWEESDFELGIMPDGCSLHLDIDSLNIYIKNVYSNRMGDVPDSYDRVVGDPVNISVDNKIFDIVSMFKSVRLQQHEMNNSINLNEIIVNK